MFKRAIVRCTVLSGVFLLQWLAAPLIARKFYDDDPIPNEPPPANVTNIRGRKLGDYYDFVANTFGKPGERPQKGKLIPARAVNTLGEVHDCAWYTNRHYRVRMDAAALARGAGAANAPDTSGPLSVVAAKTAGVMPGFRIKDAGGRLYFVKFDPKSNPEMATAADIIVSNFFYALGYNVPENYLLTFTRSQLKVSPDAALTDAQGKRRPMTDRDVTETLLAVPRTADGRYRAVASLRIEGQAIGEFRYYGTRSDDPNDIVSHEHRRDLRGLRVFCAWLGHDDTRDINTFDTLVEQGGRKYVKHYLIDFGAALGSDSNFPNSPRSGNVTWFDWKTSAQQFFSLGLAVPRWAMAKYPDIPAVGRFEADIFDPEKWVPFYPNPAFTNCLPDDAFWAAKQVMAFTDDDIRTLVRTGQFTDRRAEDWIVQCLIKRRDKIGKAYFAKVLPLDHFRIRDERLELEDLAATHHLGKAQDYAIQWSRFDNESEQKTPLAGETSARLPQAIQNAKTGEYFAARISGSEPAKSVTVYIRKEPGGIKVAGIDRTW
ncbi:MAG: hypothetical protein ABSG54_13175 [Terriglobia bacterium]